MTSRNVLLIIFLTLFFVGYISYWAYQTQYSAPRKKLNGEIAKLSQEIEAGKNNLTMMTQFCTQNVGFYYRSLPRIPNDARMYSYWLLELLQYTGFEKNNVSAGASSLLPLGADYRYSVQCTGSLAQLSNFLFEFYYAPFIHRIVSLTVTPVEGIDDQATFSMSVSALSLRPRQANDPYPSMNQLPTTGFIPRLAFNDLSQYKVIADRNLLQTAKGGIDRADYAVLTSILDIDGKKEVWFSVRTDDSVVKAKLGDSISVGSFSGKIVEILDQDIVLERNGERWLLEAGESLHEAFALPPETVPVDEAK